MAYVRTCASGTAEWRGMNRRKGVESKEGMEEMPLLYTLYSVEFQWNVAFLFARTVCTKNIHTPVCTCMIPKYIHVGRKAWIHNLWIVLCKAWVCTLCNALWIVCSVHELCYSQCIKYRIASNPGISPCPLWICIAFITHTRN